MRAVPSEISWKGLKRVKIKPLHGIFCDVRELRVGSKILRLKTDEDELTFSKMTSGYWGVRHDQLVIKMIEFGPPPGQKRFHASVSLDWEAVQTLVEWLKDGKYLPPQTRKERS